MKYANSTDYSYKFYDIAIYQNEIGFQVEVSFIGGIIAQWNDIKTFMLAGAIAQEYIDSLQGE